jgi:hypothetical protein
VVTKKRTLKQKATLRKSARCCGMMPVNHEAFLTMREYLKVESKGSAVNRCGTKFYVLLPI